MQINTEKIVVGGTKGTNEFESNTLIWFKDVVFLGECVTTCRQFISLSGTQTWDILFPNLGVCC